ncbi:hypothetical protein IJH97_01035 [Candidatus Saccharibacteria bacterium]|nr:hypothetical protein [Candidatus Saccharibacteria bacterium]
MDTSTLIRTLNLDPHCSIEQGAGNYLVVRNSYGTATHKIRQGILNGKLFIEPY